MVSVARYRLNASNPSNVISGPMSGLNVTVSCLASLGDNRLRRCSTCFGESGFPH